MKKLALFAALFSLTLLAGGCDNSPAARKAAEEKKDIKADADQMKADIKEEAKEETNAVNAAQKDADAAVDDEKKAEEGK